MTLRPLRPTDVAPLATWLPTAAAQAGCERWANEDALQRAVGRETVLVAADRDRAPLTLLDYAPHTPERGAAHVSFLAVRPDARRVGVGGRAVLAFEERLARSMRRVYVAVPADVGLALYFWLRLGYRPLIQRAWPRPPAQRPALWMARDLH